MELDYSPPSGSESIQVLLDLQQLFAKKVDLVSARGLSKHVSPSLRWVNTHLYAARLGDKARLLHILDAIEAVEKYT